MEAEKYGWLDRVEYPFTSKWRQLRAGKMRYIDDGIGETFPFLHGNPVWSFSFRKLINAFSKEFRCIAIDHIGFGLSDKPANFSYLPEDHSENLEEFIQSLNLKNITLFVNDWGGPIGFSYAVKFPANISRLVIFNTFMWSVKDDKHYERFSGFMGGRVGKFLNVNFNFIWGMKDIAFREIELKKNKGVFENPKVIKLEEVGHYVQDEGGERIIEAITSFLKR